MLAESPALDDRFAEIGADIDRQMKRIPKPAIFPPPKVAAPLYYARLLIGLMLWGGWSPDS